MFLASHQKKVYDVVSQKRDQERNKCIRRESKRLITQEMLDELEVFLSQRKNAVTTLSRMQLLSQLFLEWLES